MAWKLAWKLVVAVGLVACGALYARGAAALWREAGRGRGVRLHEALAYACGLLTAAIALLSPVDALAEVLFSVHMTQHELLMVLAAPLVVLGRPMAVGLWALPSRARARVGRVVGRRAVRRTWRAITHPLVVLVAHGVVLWGWHAPSLFEAALRSPAVHAVQHAMFFGTAALFWWALVHGRYGRVGYGVSVVYVFVTALHATALGALLTIVGRPLYPTYGGAGEALADQQLAGLIMWVPACVVMTVVGLALFAAWIGESERRARRAAGRGGGGACPHA
jgi:cytochrome c oxidase assembly factor CtaG